MKFWRNIFKSKQKDNFQDNFFEKYPEIVISLDFLNPRKNELPLKKFIDLAIRLQQKHNYDRWEHSDEYTFEKGKEKASKLNSEKFSYGTHWLYNSNIGYSRNYLMFQSMIPFISPSSYNIRLNVNISQLDMSDFKELMEDKEFACAYAFPFIDDYVQNAETVQYYELKNLSFNHKKVIKSSDKYTPDEIDITGNPGRSRQVQNMILRSCWRMWFSDNYFKVIPKEKIESFDGGKQNKVLENGLHFIELYDNPFDANKPECREIQKKFNEWIDIEGVYQYQAKHFGAKF